MLGTVISLISLVIALFPKSDKLELKNDQGLVKPEAVTHESNININKTGLSKNYTSIRDNGTINNISGHHNHVNNNNNEIGTISINNTNKYSQTKSEIKISSELSKKSEEIQKPFSTEQQNNEFQQASIFINQPIPNEIIINNSKHTINLSSSPPALITASLTAHSLDLKRCEEYALEILDKLHLEVEDHDNGTIFGYGDKSVASITCHKINDSSYVQIAVTSQKEEAAELIMSYVKDYIKISIINTRLGQ
ncbi:hypothetical protein SAMN02949497_3062 [Methylomagnum ishizawai]|uniref:Uncharacterized protein n=1 Tax=Methylomagnum ishizawai TaxID=1760988 RepID=A0A1Y6CYE2_9GAMM|nr:hypothetical protein SAMN02949497_3062 [Methylomagnum ishizawai]